VKPLQRLPYTCFLATFSWVMTQTKKDGTVVVRAEGKEVFTDLADLTANVNETSAVLSVNKS
jgi:hypothetical protein